VHLSARRTHRERLTLMSEDENVGIELGVDADAALETFQQLATAARGADTDIQALKEQLNTLTSQVTTGATTPEIAQTRQALNARRAEVQGQAMDFVGTNPQVVAQPLPDTLDQFQQAMAEREQQQQAQQQRQAHQQAAGVERPARYGYETIPPAPQPYAPLTPLSASTANVDVASSPISPIATGADPLAQALTAQAPPASAPTGASADGISAAATGALTDDIQALAAAAVAADPALRQLQERLREQVNQTFSAQGLHATTYEQAAGFVARMEPAGLAGAAPDIAQTTDAITARQVEVTGQVRDFAAATPDATSQPLSTQQDMLIRWQEALRRQSPQQQPQGQDPNDTQPSVNAGTYYQQSVRSGPLVPPPPEGMERLARYGVYGATVDQRGAANPWPAATPAFGPTSGGGVGNDTTQQDRSDTVLGDHIAQALTRSAGGLVAGGINGAANAAGMGATGDLVAGLARPLMSLMGEFAAPLAVGAAVGGAALGVGDLRAHYAGDRQSLAGSVGTTTGATPGSELSAVMNAGWAFNYKEAESAATARQLGTMGVQSDQLGGGATAAMALSRVGGIGLDQATSTVGGLMQSGMSGNQVADYLAKLDQAARQTGVSVTRLAEGVTHLNQAAGVGQISINGLAAAQALTDRTGTKIDIGQAMAGAIGATGTTALAQGALLGLNPAQFEKATQDPAVLLDSYANLAKRYDVGTGGVQVAQQAMSAAGFDFSKMDSHQADVFTRKLVAQGPGAAQAYEDSLTKKENAPGAPGPHTGADYVQTAKQIADAITGPTAKLGIVLDEGASALGNAAGAINRAVARTDPRYGLNGADTSAGPNPHHIQPTRPLQGDSTAILGPPSPYDLGINPNAIDFTNPTALAHQANRNQAPWDAHNQVLLQDNLAHNRAGDASKFGYDASGDAAFGAISGTAVNQGMAGQLKINGAGLSASTFSALEAAASRTGVPLSVLLAQSRQEATVNGKIDPSAVSADGGYGLGQFTDPSVAVKYLGQASHELGKGPVTASNWHTAALNPEIGAQAMADYDASLVSSKSAGGRFDKALAQYNAGPSGWNYTGHPGQGRDYGTGVMQSAQQIQHTLGITVTVQDQNGNKVGQTKTQHNVDTSRKVVAAQSYGPMDSQSPTVGLPFQLPRPIK
jgi:hypothetical protein